jgi:predicted dehydrogenase
MQKSRRQLLKGGAALAAAIGFPMVASSRVLAANDEIRLGVVGLGVRGSGAHIPGFSPQKDVRIVAVSDADKSRMPPAAKALEAKGHKAEQYVDMRKMFDRKDIDAVSIALMNYWHGLATIWAFQSGKHVYVEKPLSHFIWEGRQMVNAARKYDRLAQVGTQNRSVRAYAAMSEWLKAGNLGRVLYATCFANKSRRSIGKRTQPLPIPETIDYDLWCGPAKKEPVFRDQLQYDCSFTWNMGDGESCNQGVHEVDIARWVLGYKTLPRKMMSIGGRFVVDDAGDVPNTQIIYYDYPEAPILYEVHNLPKSKDCLTPQKWGTMPEFKGQRTGVCIQCEGGYTLGTTAYDNAGKKLKSFEGSGDHFVNFIEALRSGKRESLNADILEGHISTSICHAGNISYRLGKPATLGEHLKQVGDIPCWREMFDRYVKYLNDLGVEPDTSILGPWLFFDSEKERFHGPRSQEANLLVKGSYREPYVVPEVKA